MWACSICAASYEYKDMARRHIKYHHNINQRAQVICIPNSISATVSSPIPPVEIGTCEAEVMSAHLKSNDVTKHDKVVLEQNDEIVTFENEDMKNLVSAEVKVN